LSGVIQGDDATFRNEEHLNELLTEEAKRLLTPAFRRYQKREDRIWKKMNITRGRSNKKRTL
jgi:hypothetical protein